MKKSAKLDPLAPRPNLDFSKGVRGKYSNRLSKGSNLAIIDPELHSEFPNSEAVNRALHTFVAIRKQLKPSHQTRKRQSRAA